VDRDPGQAEGQQDKPDDRVENEGEERQWAAEDEEDQPGGRDQHDVARCARERPACGVSVVGGSTRRSLARGRVVLPHLKVETVQDAVGDRAEH